MLALYMRLFFSPLLYWEMIHYDGDIFFTERHYVISYDDTASEIYYYILRQRDILLRCQPELYTPYRWHWMVRYHTHIPMSYPMRRMASFGYSNIQYISESMEDNRWEQVQEKQTCHTSWHYEYVTTFRDKVKWVILSLDNSAIGNNNGIRWHCLLVQLILQKKNIIEYNDHLHKYKCHHHPPRHAASCLHECHISRQSHFL